MKQPQYLVALLFITLALQGCTGSDPTGNRPTEQVTPSATAPGVNATILRINPQQSPEFLQKSGIKPENLENKATLMDTQTLALSLTGSSSCPATPETITVLNDELNIILKSYADECTADLTTSYWQIGLPPVLIPRTTDLSVDVVNSQGITINLVASAP